MTVRVITNNQARDLIDAFELSAKERADFDYLPWDKIDAGEDSATFFRYRSNLYDLGEFSASYGITRGSGLPKHLADWHGYASDTFFSATVVRLSSDGETVVVGRVYS